MFQLKAPPAIFENNMKSFLEQIKSYCQSGACIISENPSCTPRTSVSNEGLVLRDANFPELQGRIPSNASRGLVKCAEVD